MCNTIHFTCQQMPEREMDTHEHTHTHIRTHTHTHTHAHTEIERESVHAGLFTPVDKLIDRDNFTISFRYPSTKSNQTQQNYQSTNRWLHLSINRRDPTIDFS